VNIVLLFHPVIPLYCGAIRLGKTTLLQILEASTTTKGQVWLAGALLTKPQPEISIVFQKPT
jgi:ABC-type nitrate/sulfonate/bicarbonate transport system ATPase subunit